MGAAYSRSRRADDVLLTSGGRGDERSGWPPPTSTDDVDLSRPGSCRAGLSFPMATWPAWRSATLRPELVGAVWRLLDHR